MPSSSIELRPNTSAKKRVRRAGAGESTSFSPVNRVALAADDGPTETSSPVLGIADDAIRARWRRWRGSRHPRVARTVLGDVYGSDAHARSAGEWLARRARFGAPSGGGQRL